MEQFLYNPDAMSEADIRATFIGREALLDELLDLIAHQPDGAGVQHVVLIAPRGMGKTTLLLMLKFALNDRGLQDCWQAVKFPEESYGITDLADFFTEVARLLASETGDTALARRVDELAEEHPDSEELQEVALALLKDWRRQHGKRLLLLVENIDLLLEQIGDERANARLRDVLMNDGTLILIGAATTFFLEARAYDQPLYNFFRLYNLADLDFDQMQELLRKRADLDGVTDFEQVLRSNRSRLRALEYFTGGNPRLVLILYRVVTRSDITEVRHGLEKLLDEVTPYYKAKIESLPPQQRKILDQIARITGATGEGVTPGEIARQVRLPPNQVSAQLKHLVELGYVRAANLRGRHTYYTLSEPLYAIWHQMRMGRDARRRMVWLVDFVETWFSVVETRDGNGRGNTIRTRNANMAHESLIRMAMQGHVDMTRQSITEAKLEQSLLPLARALDYLQTGNGRLIEKLSPEVRGIAKDIIARLKQHQKTPQHPAGKTRSARARSPRLGKRL